MVVVLAKRSGGGLWTAHAYRFVTTASAYAAWLYAHSAHFDTDFAHFEDAIAQYGCVTHWIIAHTTTDAAAAYPRSAVLL